MNAYQQAKVRKSCLEFNVDYASKKLKAIPGVGSGPMGLTPDHVKASAEYRSWKLTYDRAFASLRAFNTEFVRLYAKEIRADRRTAQPSI